MVMEGGEPVRMLRVFGVAVVTMAVIGIAAGTAYAVVLGRLWSSVVRATDPFDPAEPL
jgi:hypothetical protein